MAWRRGVALYSLRTHVLFSFLLPDVHLRPPPPVRYLPSLLFSASILYTHSTSPSLSLIEIDDFGREGKEGRKEGE